MQEIQSQDELVDTIKKLKRRLWRRPVMAGDPIIVAGMVFNDESGSSHPYSHFHHHTTIDYQGELFDVQTPSLRGQMAIRARSRMDRFFNDGFIEYQSPRQAAKREIEIYGELSAQGFPTLLSLPYLIAGDNGKLLVEEVVLTLRNDRNLYLPDLVRDNGLLGLEYLAGVAHQMRELHDLGFVWGNANLANAMYGDHKTKVMLHSFCLKPSENLPEDAQKTKDLVSLCMSGVYRMSNGNGTATPDEVVQSVLRGYAPEGEVLLGIWDEVRPEPSGTNDRTSFFRAQFYDRPITGLRSAEVKKVKEAIFRAVEQ